MKTTKILILLFCLPLIQACSTSAKLKTDDNAQKFEAKDSSKIKVYSAREIGRPYTVIGAVVASRDGAAEESVKILKKQASELGADAIVDLRLEIDYGYMDAATKATGTAVVLK